MDRARERRSPGLSALFLRTVHVHMRAGPLSPELRHVGAHPGFFRPVTGSQTDRTGPDTPALGPHVAAQIRRNFSSSPYCGLRANKTSFSRSLLLALAVDPLDDSYSERILN